MWSILGYFILVVAVQKTFSQTTKLVYGNIKVNLTFTTVNTNLVWEKDNIGVRNVFYDSNSNDCAGNAAIDDYDVFCMKDGSNVKYVLELQNTSLHDNSVFTGNQRIEVQNYLSRSHNISAGDLTVSHPVQVDVYVQCCTSEPKFRIELTVMSLSNETWVSTKSVACNENVPVPNTQTYSGTYSLDLPKFKSMFPNVNWNNDIENINLKIYMIIDGKTYDLSSRVFDYVNPVPPECCCYCYCLILLIIKVVLVVVAIILVIVHWSRKEAKTEGNMYWVINVGFILDGPVCFVLSIIQILYLKHIIACSRCMDRPGYNAAIAFVVFGFIVFIVCIGLFVIRLKQRGQSKKKPLGTEMLPDPEKKDNGTRPLPKPKPPKDQL